MAIIVCFWVSLMLSNKPTSESTGIVNISCRVTAPETTFHLPSTDAIEGGFPQMHRLKRRLWTVFSPEKSNQGHLSIQHSLVLLCGCSVMSEYK